jgi:predicted transcriptional regulator
MFETLLMQSDAVQSAVSLVTSYAALIAVIGTMIVAVAAYLKTKTHDPQLCKLLAGVEDIGKLSTAMGQKTVEQQKDLETFASVITTLSPEAKAELEKHQKDLAYFTEKANVATQQLNRLLPAIPKEAQANTIADLPREDKKVSAVTNK